MVAAHKWDPEGARAAGPRTAFVDRPREKGPRRRADRAEDVDRDLYASDLVDLADRLLRGQR
jgi:2-haloacid dehalogenase